MNPIPLLLAVEDDLSETVIRKILESCSRDYAVRIALGKRGSGALRSRIAAYNQAARQCPFLVVTDLDEAECPPAVVQSWLPHGRHPNLLLRIPVREIEAWVMSDRSGFGSFLGVSPSAIPSDTETISNPKEFLINLARRSRIRSIRTDIVPNVGSTAKIGPNYNARLGAFVIRRWDIEKAVAASRSLKTTIDRLNLFVPS